MSNTSSNFEMAGILLGKEVRKRKTPQEKICSCPLISRQGLYLKLTLPADADSDFGVGMRQDGRACT